MERSKKWKCPHCGARFRKTEELETLQRIGGGLFISSKPERCPSCLSEINIVALVSGEYDIKTTKPKSIQVRLEEYIIKLKDMNGNNRAGAAISIGKLGDQARSAVPAVVAALRDEDYGVRYNAAKALGKIGQGSNNAAQALIEALHYDDNEIVRENAARSLGSIGVGTEDVLSVLIHVMKNDDHSITRAAGAESLGKLNSGSKSVILALIESLKDTSVSVRLSSAGALSRVTGNDFGSDYESWHHWYQGQ